MRDDDYFPPIRRRRRSSGGFPTWIGPVIGISIVGVFVVFFVVLVVVRMRNQQERANADRQNAANSGSLGPAPPEVVRPVPGVPDRAPPITPFVPFRPGPTVPPVRPATTSLKPGVTEVAPVGGFFANTDYREYRDDGAILVGFEIGLGAVPDTAVVTYLRPIWLTPKGEQFGTAYGRTRNPIATVKARDGYAIGGILIKGGGAIEGLCFTFMRRGEKHLLKDDYYVSDWYGEQTRKLPADRPRQDVGFVVGIHGKRFDDRGGFEFDDSGCIGTLGFVHWVKE
jgi:hypothetical protein